MVDFFDMIKEQLTAVKEARGNPLIIQDSKTLTTQRIMQGGYKNHKYKNTAPRYNLIREPVLSIDDSAAMFPDIKSGSSKNPSAFEQISNENRLDPNEKIVSQSAERTIESDSLTKPQLNIVTNIEAITDSINGPNDSENISGAKPYRPTNPSNISSMINSPSNSGINKNVYRVYQIKRVNDVQKMQLLPKDCLAYKKQGHYSHIIREGITKSETTNIKSEQPSEQYGAPPEPREMDKKYKNFLLTKIDQSKRMYNFKCG